MYKQIKQFNEKEAVQLVVEATLNSIKCFYHDYTLIGVINLVDLTALKWISHLLMLLEDKQYKVDFAESIFIIDVYIKIFTMYANSTENKKPLDNHQLRTYFSSVFIKRAEIQKGEGHRNDSKCVPVSKR